MPMSNLQQIISPVTCDDFFSHYFEQKHLLIKSDEPTRFSHLASFDQLDELLGTYGMYSPDIRVVQHDRKIDAEDYMWKKGMVDPPRVAQLFANGATIIFNSLQDRVDALNRLCRGLSSEMGLKTQTNLYLTPPESQGFIPHWDSHDVFVIQIEGSKTWRIYPEQFVLPFDDEKHRYERDNIEVTDAIDEFELAPGDVLYIPRGVMHSASAGAKKSLHITLGFIAYTWTNLMRDLVESVSDEHEEWRRSVDLNADPQLITEKLVGLCESLASGDSLREIVARQHKKALGMYRPTFSNLLEQSLNAGDLEKNDHVSIYEHADFNIDDREGDEKFYLSNDRREVALPRAARKTIDLIFESRSRDVIGDYDDDIDWESRKLVIAKLIEEGFVHKTRFETEV